MSEGTPAGRLEIGGEWRRISPRYVVVELLTALTVLVVAAVAGAFPVVLSGQAGWWTWLVWGAGALGAIVLAAVAWRRVRAYGYQLREDDLLYRQGIMWQRFVAVPYGRMQLIDVNRGPVVRALGLSDLKFVTAAAATGVVLRGLPEAEADELRDRLVSLAESRRAGL